MAVTNALNYDSTKQNWFFYSEQHCHRNEIADLVLRWRRSMKTTMGDGLPGCEHYLNLANVYAEEYGEEEFFAWAMDWTR